MTFSSRWLLAFRVGGSTAASLPHCPACHVVFNHSSWLIPLPRPPHHCEKPLSSSWCALKWQQILKTWEITFFLPPSSSLPPYCYTATNTPSPLLVWNLISAAWSVWEFWPSPGVACHIQLWAPNKKRRSHTCPLFSYYPTGASIKNKTKKKKSTACFENKRLWSCCCLMQRGKKRWERRYRCCVIFFFLRVFSVNSPLLSFRRASFFYLFYFPPHPRWHFSVGTYPRKRSDYIIWRRRRRGRKTRPISFSLLSLSLSLSRSSSLWLLEFDIIVWMWLSQIHA